MYKALMCVWITAHPVTTMLKDRYHNVPMCQCVNVTNVIALYATHENEVVCPHIRIVISIILVHSIMSSATRSNVVRTKKSIANVPIVVPEAILIAMRVSCTFMALDSNRFNAFNEYSKHVTVTQKGQDGTKYTAALCSPTLIKSWLRWLCTLDVFRGYLQATPRDTKGKERNSQRVACINVPTPADIEQATGRNKDQAKDWTFVAEVLERTLLMPKDDRVKLVQPKEYRGGMVLYTDQISSPTAICKTDRLQRMGYCRYATHDQTLAREWESFSLAESRRIAHASNENKGEVISPDLLATMSKEQASTYNSLVLTKMSKNTSSVHVDRMDEMSHKRMANDVNPASFLLVQYTEQARRSKTGGKESTRKRYSDMIKEIHRETGHRLDLDEEMNRRTLDHRVKILEWVQEMRHKDPSVRFAWDKDSDDIVIRDYRSVSRATSSVQASRRESPPGRRDESIYQGGTASTRVTRPNREIQEAMNKVKDNDVTYLRHGPSFDQTDKTTQDDADSEGSNGGYSSDGSHKDVASEPDSDSSNGGLSD